MQFKPGQIIEQYMNGLKGIVLEHKTSPHNSYYNKAVVYCIFAPYNSSLVGQTLKLNADGLKVIDEKPV